MLERIQAAFPGHAFIGEEGSALAGFTAALTDAPTWMVDPVDGEGGFGREWRVRALGGGFLGVAAVGGWVGITQEAHRGVYCGIEQEPAALRNVGRFSSERLAAHRDASHRPTHAVHTSSCPSQAPPTLCTGTPSAA